MSKRPVVTDLARRVQCATDAAVCRHGYQLHSTLTRATATFYTENRRVKPTY